MKREEDPRARQAICPGALCCVALRNRAGGSLTSMFVRWLKRNRGGLRTRGGLQRMRLQHAPSVEAFRRHQAICDVVIGIDPGTVTSGIAVVVDGRCVWAAEIHHRTKTIRRAMQHRAMLRTGRRGRRAARQRALGRAPKPGRWRHRPKPSGWLPPSVEHIVGSLERWTGRLARAWGGARVHVETAAFDPAKLADPDISGTQYQRGTLNGSHLRAYVLERDRYRCVYCHRKGQALTLDHVVAKSAGGADAAHNRVAACRDCNTKKGAQNLETFVWGLRRINAAAKAVLVKDIQARAQRPLPDAAQMNAMRHTLVRRLRALPDVTSLCERTSSDTSWLRQHRGWTKTHWVDAAVVAGAGRMGCHRGLRLTLKGRGRRQCTPVDRHGFPRRRRDGHPIVRGRTKTVDGLRGGDSAQSVTQRKGVRFLHGTVVILRSDGRAVIENHNGEQFNTMAHQLKRTATNAGSVVR